MRLAWPEKVAIIAAATIGTAVFLFGAAINGASTSYEWVNAGGEIWLHFCRIVVLPLWIVLRIIDMLCGGPRRRRGIIGRLPAP